MAARGIARLTELYARLEHLRALELEMATIAVTEVQRVEDAERQQRQSQAAESRAALAAGDRVEWVMTEHDLQLQRGRLELLAGWRERREQLQLEALRAHRASRMEREQMARMAEERRRAELLEAERRDQAASDDRYLSRRLWCEQVQ